MYNAIKNDHFVAPASASNASKDFIARMLEKDPRKRLGAKGKMDEIKGHSLFKGINWDDIFYKRHASPIKLNYRQNYFDAGHITIADFSDTGVKGYKYLIPDFYYTQKRPITETQTLVRNIVKPRKSSDHMAFSMNFENENLDNNIDEVNKISSYVPNYIASSNAFYNTPLSNRAPYKNVRALNEYTKTAVKVRKIVQENSATHHKAKNAFSSQQLSVQHSDIYKYTCAITQIKPKKAQPKKKMTNVSSQLPKFHKKINISNLTPKKEKRNGSNKMLILGKD